MVSSVPTSRSFNMVTMTGENTPPWTRAFLSHSITVQPGPGVSRRSRSRLQLSTCHSGSHGATDADERCHVTRYQVNSTMSQSLLVVRSTDDRLPLLFHYVNSTCLTHTTCTSDSVGVCRRTVRTNNDVDGWHRRLNTIARRGHLPL